MSYEAYELSVESGRPVELYTFTVGAVIYRYTSAEDTVTYSAQDYLPRLIDRTSPTLTSKEGGKRQLELTLPKDDVVSQRYISVLAATPLQIEIVRFHRDDTGPNGITVWRGRVVAAKFEQQATVCRLYSVSSESALSRPIPGRKYQGLCNHVLYDGICQIDKDSWKYTGNVSAESGRTITVDGLSAKGASWAVGGTVEFGDEEFRLIVGQSGDVLTLQMEFPFSLTGSDVSVFAGCNHSFAQCYLKFNNAVNFGGFPFVPTRNPFNTGL